MRRFIRTLAILSLTVAAAGFAEPTTKPGQPAVGQTAPDFTLDTLDRHAVSLYGLTKNQNVVLVALRGWPGYQCPICTKQVAELIKSAKTLEEQNAHVLLVYPGPSDELQARAGEFMANTTLPANFSFVIDPDYTFTNLYQLRWDAKGETAYPSTFVVDQKNVVRFAKISKTHGGRASIADVIGATKNAE